jgi:HK97 family phage prohead protease
MTTTQSPRIAMNGGREFRTFATKLEANIGGLEFRVEGYASVTESPYDMGSYEETISRSAFTKTLSMRPDIQLLVNHEGLPLARTTVAPGQPGHLQLSEDSKGLRFDVQLDRDDPDAQTLMRKVGVGLMDQASFAFRVIRQSWNDAHTLRTINEVSLDRGDVSIVNYGASPSTPVDARALVKQAKGYPLSLAQARARAIALRVCAGPTPNIAYYKAQA